jgi:hypothetical protein
MNPFSYLRRKFAETVVLGINDGIAAVTPEGETPPSDLAGLRALVAANIEPKALPGANAAEDEEPATARRKKQS